jgi:glycosyltransferase involved in cell wall biosynthesis
MIKVFIVCTGLGHIKRGFEAFTQDCFDALSQVKTIDITLFKSSGKHSKKEIVLSSIRRNDRIALETSKVFKEANIRDPYFFEQSPFFLKLLPHIYTIKPDVIYFSEGILGTLLWRWQNFKKQNYKLLFCNGGPVTPTYFYRWDHVQQVAPTYLKAALDVGVPAEKQTLVPYAIHMSSELHMPAPNEREARRHRLGLPEKRPLILSVAAINTHKRMDYVIREIATLPEPRPYLLLLGQQDAESPEILQLGSRLLGTEHFQIRTVDRNEVADYYIVADVFVLASLHEGFGIVFLEAMSYGLPCLAHDYAITRFCEGAQKITGSPSTAA